MKGLTIYTCVECREDFCMVQTTRREAHEMVCPVCRGQVDEVIVDDDEDD